MSPDPAAPSPVLTDTRPSPFVAPGPSATPRTLRVLLLAALALVAAALLIDLHLTRKYGGIDLRDKVVGARSLLEGRSPYFEPWQPGDPERFADPSVPPGSPLTRYTGSPFQALVMAPLARAPFPATRMAWLFLQYAMLLFSVGLMLRETQRGSGFSAAAALAVLAVVVLSGSWRLHVERGQVYTIFALLIALLFVAANRRQDLLLGALGALLILFKPTYGLLLLPLAVRLNARMVLGGVATVVVAMTPFLFLPGGFSSWVEYGEAMAIWGANPGEGAIPPTGAEFAYPAVIEGSTALWDHHPMEAENGSVAAILHAFGIPIPAAAAYLTVLLLMAAVAVPFWGRLRRTPLTDLLLFGFCLNTVLMIMLPTLRFHYQFVVWTAPLLYVLLSRTRLTPGWTVAAVAAGLLVVGGLELLPVNVLLAEFILLGLFLRVLVHRLHRQGQVVVPAP
jgi:hypothetical protein